MATKFERDVDQVRAEDYSRQEVTAVLSADTDNQLRLRACSFVF
jgi:hypothetical protein